MEIMLTVNSDIILKKASHIYFSQTVKQNTQGNGIDL